MPLVRRYSGVLPILGVCLGHQAIAEAFGGRTIHAHKLMHGKASMVKHQGGVLFQGVSTPFAAGRYHSLMVEETSLPSCLQATAFSEDDGCIMALTHNQDPTFGIQFHPESVLTPSGKTIIKNFLNLCSR